MRSIGDKNKFVEEFKKQEFKKKHKEGKKNKQTWVVKKDVFLAFCQNQGKKTFSKSAQQAFEEFVRLTPKQTDLYISSKIELVLSQIDE